MKGFTIRFTGLFGLVWLYFIACYFYNIYLFITCDFAEPWKDEIIRGLGIIIAVLPGISVWF